MPSLALCQGLRTCFWFSSLEKIVVLYSFEVGFSFNLYLYTTCILFIRKLLQTENLFVSLVFCKEVYRKDNLDVHILA